MNQWLNKKNLFRIHGWLGLNLGLLMFVICFSGTCAVFGPEFDWLANPALRVTPPGPDTPRLTWSEIYDRVAAAHPHGSIRSLSAPANDRSTAVAWVTYGGDDLRDVHVDPYTGRVQGQTSPVSMKSFLRIFHKQFYIVPRGLLPHGLLIVAPFGLILAFSVLTALLFYQRWWQSLVRLRIGRGPRVFWSDLHRMTGVWAMLLTVVLGLTGAWYLVERMAEEADVELVAPPPRVDLSQLPGNPPVLELMPLDRLIATASQAYPQLQITTVWLPVRTGDPLVVQGPAEAWLVRNRANRVYVDPYSGDVIQVVRATKLPPLQRWSHTADPLHFGTLGGLPTRIIWFISGLLLCVGILTGPCIWWRRVSRPGAPFFKKSRLATAASVAFSLGVLGASVYSGLAFTGEFLDAPHRTPQPVPIGTAAIGPWQVTAFRHAPEMADPVKFSIRFEPGTHAHLQRAEMWIGSEPGPGGTVEPRILGDRLVASSVPRAAETPHARLHLRIIDRDGAAHEADFGLTPAPEEAPLAWRAALPPPPTLPAGVRMGIGLFIALTAMPVILWLVLVR